jgi:hypothetical protein
MDEKLTIEETDEKVPFTLHYLGWCMARSRA